MPWRYKCTSKTFEAILGQIRGVFRGFWISCQDRHFFSDRKKRGISWTKQGKCKMLHVSATFKRDYTLDLFFKIIIYNNLDYRRGGFSLCFLYHIHATFNILSITHPRQKHHRHPRKSHFSLRKTHFFSAKITLFPCENALFLCENQLFPLKNHKNITLDDCQRHTS